MQPKFIELPEIKMVGLGTRFISVLSPDKNNFKTIPKLWDQFIQRIGQIRNRVGETCYGLIEPLAGDEKKSHRDELFYIAAAEVADVDSAPAGMLHRVVPAGRYASFTHRGKLDGLEATMKYIHGSWLPKADAKLRDAPHLEVYDHRFNPGSDQSEFDILLPVR